MADTNFYPNRYSSAQRVGILAALATILVLFPYIVLGANVDRTELIRTNNLIRADMAASNALFLTTNKVTGSAVQQNGNGTITIDSTSGLTLNQATNIAQYFATNSAIITSNVVWTNFSSRTIPANGPPFNIAGNGSDQSAGFFRLRTFLRTNDGCTVVFTNGFYSYTNNLWLAGIKNVTVDGNGSWFTNIGNGSFDFERAALYINLPVLSGQLDDNAFSSANTTSSPIATVSMGYTNITLSVANDTNRFSIGMPILISGFSQQAGKDNPRYFEFNEVAGFSSGGVLILQRATRYNYDSRWFDLPGSALPLWRTNYVFGENIVLRRMKFGRSPNLDPTTYGTSTAPGAVYAVGSRNIIIDDCDMFGFVPSHAGEVIVRNSRITGYNEPDKILDTVVFDDHCELGEVNQATGVNHLLVLNSIVRNYFQAEPRYLSVRNSQILATEQAASQILLTDARATRLAAIENCTFYQPSNTLYSLINCGGTNRFTNLVSTAANEIQIRHTADTNFLYSSVLSGIDIGTRLHQSGGTNDATITNIICNSSNLIIQGTWGAQPSGGDIFYSAKVREVRLVNPVVQPWGSGFTNAFLYGDRPERTVWIGGPTNIYVLQTNGVSYGQFLTNAQNSYFGQNANNSLYLGVNQGNTAFIASRTPGWGVGISYDRGTNIGLIMDGSGQVGIGTNIPSARLHVSGTVQFDNLGTNSSPDFMLGVKNGQVINTPTPSGGGSNFNTASFLSQHTTNASLYSVTNISHTNILVDFDGRSIVRAFPTNGAQIVFTNVPSAGTPARRVMVELFDSPGYSILVATSTVVRVRDTNGIFIATNGLALTKLLYFWDGTNVWIDSDQFDFTGQGPAVMQSNATTYAETLVSPTITTPTINGQQLTTSVLTNLYSAGNTNSTHFSLAQNGTNNTGAIKTISAGANVTISGEGQTNLVISSSASGGSADVESNIIVSATNNVVFDFAAANIFRLTLLTNWSETYSNQTRLTNWANHHAMIYYQQPTSGPPALLQNYAVDGGIRQTNANQQPTTNSSGLDVLEVIPGFFKSNVLSYWPQNFQPRVAFTNSSAGGGGGGNGLLNNLFAVWEFEQADNTDTTDATGNGRTLTHFGTTQRSATHIEGTFATDSAQNAGFSNLVASAYNTNGDFSIVGWANGGSDGDAWISWNGGGSAQNTLTIYFDHTGTFAGGVDHWKAIVRKADNTGNYTPVSSTVTISGAGWHMIAVVVDGTAKTTSLSVDGETFVTTGTTDGLSPSLDEGFQFGRVASLVDETAWWVNRKLSQSDITTLYNSGSGFFYSGGGWQN